MTKKILTAIFALTACAAATSAQTNPEQAILSAREQISDIKNRSIELERMKRESYKPAGGNIYAPKFPAIKKDFETMQKINDAAVKLNAAEKPLDFVAVAKIAEQINQRAVRLKSNLFADRAESKKTAKNVQPESAARDLKIMLADLDKFVVRFVHSPIFQNLNVVNSTDSLQAQKDLEKIITLSRAIKLQTKD